MSMKRSSPSLQFLAVAASTDATATATATTTTFLMSSRPPYRGGRNQWRRGYSDRNFTDGRDDQFVTGDSHFRSVRDANRSSFGPEDNHNQFRSLPRPPSFNPRPSFERNLRPFTQNQQFRPPPFYQNQQQFRPRPPKPLDYRNWEYARPGPHPDSERFTVLSYNILADYLAINHRSKLYFHIPRHILDWEFRKRSIIFELGLWSADILCFQEVDRFQDLEVELKVRGYNGIWKMRTGDPVDGCAIFWRVSRFKLLHEESIEFSKLGLRDNVAQICVFESMNQSQNHNKSTSGLPASATGYNKVVICNIHVLYNPKRGEIKLGQVRVLLERAYAVSKLWDDAPVILCGDFNCTPESPLYTFISEQKLNLSELPRDKLSGQASAEIHPQRPFYPNYRGQPSDNLASAPTMVEEREVRQSDTPLDTQRQNGLDSNLESISITSRLPEPRCANTVLNVSDNSYIKRQHDHENSASSYEPMEEAHQGEDVCKDETKLILCAPVSDLNECTRSSHSEGGSSVDQMKDEINEYSPPNSHQEDIYPVETGFRGDTSNASCVSSSEHSRAELHTENKSLKCENYMAYTYSTDATIHLETASTFNSDKASSDLLHEIPSSNVLEVSHQGISENRSSLSHDNDCASTLYGADIPYTSVSIDVLVNNKMENLSLNEPVEAIEDDGIVGEDCTAFLSELHSADDSFPSDFSQFPRSDFVGCSDNEASNECVSTPQQLHSPGLASEPFYVERTTYDPSAWTPMEIETATGSSECTLVEHPLKLRSTYSEVEDPFGTRDSNGEPLVTSYNRCFLGTVDYIWCSQGLQTVRVLAPIPRHAMQWTPGFPTKKWGSDHIALVSELAFTNDATLENAEVE